MKTKILSKVATMFAFLLTLTLLPSVSKAQATCPYTIQNNTSCQLLITYTIFCNNGWYTNTVTVAPSGGTYVIQCSEFPTGCDRKADVELNLLQVDGIDFICVAGSSNTVASCCQTASTAGMFPGAACDPINITWGPTGCTYN